MNNSSKLYLVPVVCCLLISFVWIPAENGFFANQLIKVNVEDSVPAALEKMERIDWLTKAANKTCWWMSSNLMVWNQEDRITVTTLVAGLAHNFFHTGVVNSIAMIGLLGLFGGMAENRNGSGPFLLLLLAILITNAIVVIYLRTAGPIYGCWAILAGYSASLLCSSNGNMRYSRSLVLRLCGFGFLATVYFQWTVFDFSFLPRWELWIPASAVGAIGGLLTWCVPNKY